MAAKEAQEAQEAAEKGILEADKAKEEAAALAKAGEICQHPPCSGRPQQVGGSKRCSCVAASVPHTANWEQRATDGTF